MVGEVKAGLRLVNTLMRPPFTLNENKLSALNADTLDRMAKDHGVTMLPVREAIVALAFELGVNDVQVARKHALSFMDGFRLPEVQELYDQHVIDHDFYRALAIEVSDCAKRQQESVARALQKQKEDEKAKEMLEKKQEQEKAKEMLRKKQEQEKAKEMLRKKQESEKKLNDAINDALKKNRERLSEEHPNFSELEVIEYMALMRFTPMALELLYSTSGSTSPTPADVVNAIKMVHPGLTVVDENTKWVDVEDAFERLAKCTSTKPKDRLFRLLSLAEQGALTIPKLQDHWKKRSAEKEAEGRTDAKRQC
jgi:leucyl aminopeptidase (aminopeptidase T)